MIILTRSKRSLEKKEEPVPSPSMSGLQRTPKAEHPSRKRTVSQSSTSLSSGTGSGKEGSQSTKGNSTSKHRKGEDKGRGTRDGKVGVSNLIARAFGVWIPGSLWCCDMRVQSFIMFANCAAFTPGNLDNKASMKRETRLNSRANKDLWILISCVIHAGVLKFGKGLIINEGVKILLYYQLDVSEILYWWEDGSLVDEKAERNWKQRSFINLLDMMVHSVKRFFKPVQTVFLLYVVYYWITEGWCVFVVTVESSVWTCLIPACWNTPG